MCHLVTGGAGRIHVPMVVPTGHRVHLATGELTGYMHLSLPTLTGCMCILVLLGTCVVSAWSGLL